MQIDVRQSGDVHILDCSGKLEFGEATAKLRSRSKELIAGGGRYFLLNLLDVPWLDSSAMGEVVAFHKRAREKRGVVRLVLNDKSRTLFTMTHLEKMFDIFDSLDPALKAFSGPEGGYQERF